MNLYLWEWEADALFVEFVVDTFVCIEEDIPVIVAIYPYTDWKEHSVVAQFVDGNEGCGVFEDTTVATQEFLCHLFHLFGVCSVFYADNHVYATQVVFTVVGDVTAWKR